MTRSFRQGGFQRRSQRIRDWGLGPATFESTVIATGKLLWTVGATPAQNLTVIRTRGLVTVSLQVASGIGDGYAGAHGIYMMTEDAFAVGVTAALDLQADSNSDMWLWHSFFDVHGVTATIADGSNAVSNVHRIEIDSKAMRKDFDAERVMVGVTGVEETGTASLQIHSDSRMLAMI